MATNIELLVHISIKTAVKKSNTFQVMCIFWPNLSTNLIKDVLRVKPKKKAIWKWQCRFTYSWKLWKMYFLVACAKVVLVINIVGISIYFLPQTLTLKSQIFCSIFIFRHWNMIYLASLSLMKRNYQSFHFYMGLIRSFSLLINMVDCLQDVFKTSRKTRNIS